MAHTDDSNVHHILAIEDVIDKLYKRLYIVPLFRVTRKADKHQIASDLHGSNTMHSCQNMGKDMGNPLIMTRE